MNTEGFSKSGWEIRRNKIEYERRDVDGEG